MVDREEVRIASAGAAPSPRPICPACRRPIPPELPTLSGLVLDLLDSEGPTSGRKIGGRLHRRAADVRAALHELAAAGLVRLEQPTGSARSKRWATVAAENRRGRAWDAHERPSEPGEAFSDVPERKPAPAASAPWPLRTLLALLVGALAAFAPPGMLDVECTR